MGKAVLAVMGAFGVGTFATTFLEELVGLQAEAAALGIAGVSLIVGSQLLTRRAVVGARGVTEKCAVPRARVPAQA